MKALDQESQELRANPSQYMGAPLPLSRITTGTDSLNIEASAYMIVANNLSVDPWVNELLPKANEVTVKRERIVNGLVYLQSNAAFAVELAKVRGGPILWEVIERALAKQSCTDQCAGQSTCTCYPSKLKYYLYSTHTDGLVASLGFSTLDVDSDTLPPDSSCFFFELWRAADGTYYIKVI
ncbi:Protein PHO-10 [Aphelenchoides avenae]|nr:Protein PHO-10 [Aphelenchus avenae]